jgi:hypothetical protein
MANKKEETTNWPDLAANLYDKLTGRNAEITYEFDQFEVDVPSGTGQQQEHAHWKMNGTLRVRTQDLDAKQQQKTADKLNS